MDFDTKRYSKGSIISKGWSIVDNMYARAQEHDKNNGAGRSYVHLTRCLNLSTKLWDRVPYSRT